MDEAPLSQGRIARFFLPLAVSWIFMAVEAPISIGVISRMPFPKVNTAAFLLMMGLALWIESPVIDLLSTSTTLSRSRRSYQSITRFALLLMAWVTFAHFVAVATPVYDLIVYRVMDVPEEVGAAARSGLMIMLPWSALIGWRRYLQGILIRNGYTRTIGLGTAVRVSVMAVSSVSLYLASSLHSIVVVATALILSVGAEAAFIHAVSRRVVRELTRRSEPDEPIENRRLAAFHFPLTATTLVTMLASPLITAALSRDADSIRTMAAFQVASTLLFLFRTTTFAIPEVVITLSQEHRGPEALWRFCFFLGSGLSGLLLIFALSPLDDLVFRSVLAAPADVVPLASSLLLLGASLPLVNAMLGYVRGMLTAHHLTLSRMVAVVVSMSVLGGMLALGVAAHWPGIVTAAVALTVSLVTELGVLGIAWHRGRNRI
ncbi:MAG TPA: hypothetical protein VGE01_01100, partial [Fimbriimonas sp.]